MTEREIDVPGMLARIQPPPQIDLKQWSQEFRDVYQISEALCKTPFVPKEMIGNQAMVAAAIMRGRELGLDPFDALGSIYVVHGRVGYYAEFQRRRIIQAGHTFRIIESSDTRCIVEGIRKEGGEPQRASFSADQARKAGIDLGKYPADKLVARATSRLCRQAFPDVLSGTLIAEDIIDGLIPATPDEPTPTEDQPPRQTLTRRRQTKPPTAARTQPPTTPAIPQNDDDLFDEDTPQPQDHSVASQVIASQTSVELPSAAPLKPVADTVPDTPTPTKKRAKKATPSEDEAQALHISGGIEPLTPEELDHGYQGPEHDGPAEMPPLITPDQLTKMMTLFSKAGMGGKDPDARQARHDYVSLAISRNIDSAKDLTFDEASLVIEILENDTLG